MAKWPTLFHHPWPLLWRAVLKTPSRHTRTMSRSRKPDGPEIWQAPGRSHWEFTAEQEAAAGGRQARKVKLADGRKVLASIRLQPLPNQVYAYLRYRVGTRTRTRYVGKVALGLGRGAMRRLGDGASCRLQEGQARSGAMDSSPSCCHQRVTMTARGERITVHPILVGLTESHDQRKGWIAQRQPSISDKDEVPGSSPGRPTKRSLTSANAGRSAPSCQPIGCIV